MDEVADRDCASRKERVLGGRHLLFCTETGKGAQRERLYLAMASACEMI